jgi:cold shock CspA family protein
MLVYEDNITNIDLDEPLGGEEILEFEDYNFSMEGIYNLELNMPVPKDDYPYNNLYYKLKVRVDDTSPYSWHTLDPPLPDGENGWYANDLKVTLTALDPLSNNVSSGVKEIKYKVRDGPVETIHGIHGRFFLTQEDDGDDVQVEYWAIDMVGNEETQHNTFTVDMDQTSPVISLDYEWNDTGESTPYLFTFNATATDDTSKMQRVEFWLNAVLQETVIGPGPLYTMSIPYVPLPKAIFRAIAYDFAGLSAFDDVIDPRSKNSVSQSISTSSQPTNIWLIKWFDRFPFFQKILTLRGGN